jgi:hypothetical protein
MGGAGCSHTACNPLITSLNAHYRGPVVCGERVGHGRACLEEVQVVGHHIAVSPGAVISPGVDARSCVALILGLLSIVSTRCATSLEQGSR